jgi:Ni/Co efflux regulator RcnB
MLHHLTSFAAPVVDDARARAARTSDSAQHEREVRLVRESLWRRPQTGTGHSRGR